MTLKVKNLEVIATQAKELAESVLNDDEATPQQQRDARDLIARIDTHEAIHGAL